MATGNLTNDGKILLQSKITSIAKRVALKGTQNVFGTGSEDLDVGYQNITWTSPNASTGVSLTNYESFNVGTSTTVTPRVVQGITLRTLGNEDLLTQDFPTNQQATYEFDDDGSNGRYTISNITINFS